MRRSARTQSSLLIEVIGWAGVLAITVAYIGSSLGWMQPSSLVYSCLNGLGSAAILLEAVHKRDWQPVALNAIWLVVAVLGLIRFFTSTPL